MLKLGPSKYKNKKPHFEIFFFGLKEVNNSYWFLSNECFPLVKRDYFITYLFSQKSTFSLGETQQKVLGP